jgi:hypothetical protein
VAVTHSHRPTIYGPGVPSSPTSRPAYSSPGPRGWLLRPFGTSLKYLRGLKTFCLWRGRPQDGRMDSEGGAHFERQGLLPPLSLIRVKATALLCSLNILALPAQDEPTCICGRGCLVKPRLLLQSFCARVPAPELRGCRLTSAKASGKVCCPWVDRFRPGTAFLPVISCASMLPGTCVGYASCGTAENFKVLRTSVRIARVCASTCARASINATLRERSHAVSVWTWRRISTRRARRRESYAFLRAALDRC